MSLIPWGRIAALVAVLAVLGWIGYQIRDGGKQVGIDQGERDRAVLAERLSLANAQLATCAGTLGRITTETDRGIREAEARARAGEAEAEKARLAAIDSEARAARASGALTAAKRLPTCRAQLEMELCPEVQLL